ncbi:kelch-like protein 15 isoform X2 [Columba livia]|uniref:kelch-like protein 15 isoform X2 n=1 Tax=Columba livia TaxID=8932 RepID=UPI0031B9C321
MVLRFLPGYLLGSKKQVWRRQQLKCDDRNLCETGLRSSSLAVCRRDLKIIFRLSLPQTANSKMTVSPPAPPSAAAIGFMLHGGPLHRRSSGRSRVFSAAAAERLYIVQIYWTLFLKLWKFGFLSETFDIQE